MEYKILNDTHQLDEIDKLSHKKPQLIYKHSTRCSISHMVKLGLDNDLQQQPNDNFFDIYYLDLLNYQDISDSIASLYQVEHSSPQILVIKEGKSIYNASHTKVNLNDALLKL